MKMNATRVAQEFDAPDIIEIEAEIAAMTPRERAYMVNVLRNRALSWQGGIQMPQPVINLRQAVTVVAIHEGIPVWAAYRMVIIGVNNGRLEINEGEDANG